MKRLFTALLLLALLTGCGARAETEDRALSGPETPPEVPMAPGEGVSMALEHLVYDPSLTRYTYFIRNGTGKTVEFGEPYSIQRREGSRWQEVSQPGAFTAIGYALGPGESLALTCVLDPGEAEPGEYRLVKTVGDTVLYAKFALGGSIYTAETPYGLRPLEDLPEAYGADTASELDVVFAGDGMGNQEAVEEFLFKAGLGASCQLRTVQDYGEGAVMVTDVLYENDSFLRRERLGGVVTEQRFSYLVTDGRDLYLSNGADWDSGERCGGARTLLIPEEAPAGMIAAVEEMTERRLAGNVTRYRLWSADGVWDACLTDVPTEFGVGWQREGQGSWGELFDLQNWDGVETGILGLAWQGDNTLLLKCETFDGGVSYHVFDPETKRLTAAGAEAWPVCSLPPAPEWRENGPR